jgi:hypothetical protein
LKPPLPTPLVGEWDVTFTPKAEPRTPVAGLASFHGDGRFAIGARLDAPEVAGSHAYADGTLTLRRDDPVEKGTMVLTWDAAGDEFRLERPEATVTFRRRPVVVRVTTAQVQATDAPGGRQVIVRARVEADHAPGLPLELRCRVFDDEGRRSGRSPGHDPPTPTACSG